MLENEGAVAEVVESTETGLGESTEQTTGLDPIESPEASQDQVNTQEQASGETKEPNARVFMDKYIKGDEFKALQQSNPALAKHIRNNHQILTQMSLKLAPFGGISGLTKMVEAVTGIGGLDNLGQFTEMSERLAEFEEIDAQLEEGNPEWVNSVAEEMPEVFAQMMPVAIDKWAQTNPEVFKQFRAKLLVDEIYQRDHVFDYLVNAYRALPDSDQTKEGKALLFEIYKWFGDQKKLAGQQPQKQQQAQGVQPNSREAKLAEREQQITLNSANKSVESYCYPAYLKEAAKFGLKLDGEDLKDFNRWVDEKVHAKLQKDQDWQKTMARLVKKGDSEGIVAAAKPRIDKLIPDAVKEVYQTRFKGRGRFANIRQQVATVKPVQNQKQQPIRTNGTQVTSGKPVMVAKKPDVSQMDKRNTTQKMILNKQAYLLDGRLVQWP